MYLHCISRGYTRSGLFLANFIFLWFPTLTIILVKLVCKACYNLYINAQICYFYCILGPLWPVTSEATVAPLPLYSSIWVWGVHVHMGRYILFQLFPFVSINKAKYTDLQVFLVKMLYFHILVIVIILYLGQNCLFSFVCVVRVIECAFVCRLCAEIWTNRGLVNLWVFIPNSFQIPITCQSY